MPRRHQEPLPAPQPPHDEGTLDPEAQRELEQELEEAACEDQFLVPGHWLLGLMFDLALASRIPPSGSTLSAPATQAPATPEANDLSAQ